MAPRHLVAMALAALALGLGCDGDPAPAPSTSAPSSASPSRREATPARQAPVAVALGYSPDPMRLSGVAGGPVNAASISGGPCYGFIQTEPSHVLLVTDAHEMRRLRLLAWGDAEIGLTVRYPDGTYECDPYSEPTRGPDMQLFGGDGEYAVWVGAVREGTQVPYTLGITTRSQEALPSESFASSPTGE